MMFKIQQKFFLTLFLAFMFFGLSGCFKAEISVDVKDSGKGMIGMAFGVTQEAKALLSISTSNESGTTENPIETLQQAMKEKIGVPGVVQISNWIEGDYEWMKAEKGFNDLDELNLLFDGIDSFKSFSITRKNGFFQNEFLFDGELAPLSDNAGTGTGVQVDPTAFIQMRFALRLPGKIIETNGISDSSDPNRMVWTMMGKQSVHMSARSATWNWINIGILAGVGGLLVLISIGVIGFTFFKRTPRPNLAPAQQKSVSSQQQVLESGDQLASLGVADLLQQVNERALNNSGEFYNKLGVIMLAWKDTTGRQKFIDVKDLGLQKISINGQVFPATKENAKAGILRALKE